MYYMFESIHRYKYVCILWSNESNSSSQFINPNCNRAPLTSATADFMRKGCSAIRTGELIPIDWLILSSSNT